MNRRRRKLPGNPASPAQQRSGLLHNDRIPCYSGCSLICAVYQGEAAKLKELELSGLVDFTTDSAE